MALVSFSDLYRVLSESRSQTEWVEATANYLGGATPEDAAWVLNFLLGKRLKRQLNKDRMETLAIMASGMPQWLFDECRKVARDTAETAALILPDPPASTRGSAFLSIAETMDKEILPLSGMADRDRDGAVTRSWSCMSTSERLLYNRLILGSLRMKIPERLLVQAISRASGVSTTTIRLRLSRPWVVSPDAYIALVAPETKETTLIASRPFGTSAPWNEARPDRGLCSEWRAEWKWTGIRVQIVRTGDRVLIWSRNGELLNNRYAEIEFACSRFPAGSVLEGHIVTYLAKPIERPEPRTAKSDILDRSALVVFDVLSAGSEDVRGRPHRERMRLLDLIAESLPDPIHLDELDALNNPGARSLGGVLYAAQELVVRNWEDLEAALDTAREMNADGIMLKRRDATYGEDQHGEPGSYAWNAPSHIATAVLIYAERGQGPDPSQHLEYTLGVRRQSDWVPIAKVRSNLAEEERSQVETFVRQNTMERFGPVRTVKPELLFEVVFDDVTPSSRHKAGFTLKRPRLGGWIQGASLELVTRFEDLVSLLRK
ncbi:MAG: hypothetical protein P4L46_24135 [Fimbriimonas sp.]|nr:hypothetical protein [Fimbriimonas sp.]